VDSTAARSWALKSIPPMVRESLLHHTPSENCENTTIKFWSLLYSSQFYYVHIPHGLSEKSREIVISYLITGIEQDKGVQTLIFKDLGVSSPKEVEIEKKFLQNSHFLTIFVHRKGANNELLKTLGENCHFLQVIHFFACVL
jgi:hypothetical protein